MNLSNYQIACRYAKKLTKKDPIDLVHDAFLTNFANRGGNLFDRPISHIKREVKSIFLKRLEGETRHYVGFYGKHRKYDQPKSKERRMQYLEFAPVTESNPELEYLAKEKEIYIKELINTTPKKYSEILKLKSQGYRNVEIGKELNMSKTLVGYYLRQVNFKHILN